MSRIAIVLCFVIFLSCKKSESLEPESLPPALATLYNEATNCEYCPFNISHIVYEENSYYKVSPDRIRNSTVVCDYIAGIVIYDSNGTMIEINSDLYNAILSSGSDRGIIYSCKTG